MSEGLNAATSEIQDKIAEEVASQILGGEIPCAVSPVKDLSDALQSDFNSGNDYATASQNLQDLAGGVYNASTSSLVSGYIYAAAKGQVDSSRASPMR